MRQTSAHDPVHDDGHHFEQLATEQAWDERYRSRPQAWSGDPNGVLVAEVSGLRPGTALDAGAGEGGDAIWLAERGWTVTGADFSTAALERAARRSGQLGLDIDWQHLDLSRQPVPGTYDLVSSFYLHIPVDQRPSLWAHLCAAVAPGGSLLVVGHDLRDLATTVPRPFLTEMGWGVDEVVAALDGGWTVVTAEARPRPATDPDGRAVTIHDAVVRARRSAAG